MNKDIFVRNCGIGATACGIGILLIAVMRNNPIDMVIGICGAAYGIYHIINA